jgi:hypothetical protein
MRKAAHDLPANDAMCCDETAKSDAGISMNHKLHEAIVSMTIVSSDAGLGTALSSPTTTVAPTEDVSLFSRMRHFLVELLKPNLVVIALVDLLQGAICPALLEFPAHRARWPAAARSHPRHGHVYWSGGCPD